jgi:hypothetical protein
MDYTFDSIHLNSAASLIRRRVGGIRQMVLQTYSGFLTILNIYSPNDTVKLMTSMFSYVLNTAEWLLRYLIASIRPSVRMQQPESRWTDLIKM